jgi:hypothetical protein
VPDEAGSAHALAQQSKVVLAPEETGSTPALTLTLRHLEDPPEGMSIRDVVKKTFPDLEKALFAASYYIVGEEKNGNHPSTQEISQKFPLLADAEKSEIEKYVIRREETAHRAALKMIAKIRGLPVETITRYRYSMRKDKPNGGMQGTERSQKTTEE